MFTFAAGLCAQTMVIKNVTLIDGTGAAARRASVAIYGDRIGEVAKKVRTTRDTRVIDGKGKFLIPGLWDMHAHVNLPEIYFPLLVANGITGIREMFTGIPIAAIRQWSARPEVPRIVAPGFIDGPPMLWNGPPAPGAIAVETSDQARYAVDVLARSGADFIKVYSAVPREAYFALAAEARAMGIVFAGHVPEAVSPLEASEAGQRSQEHLMNILLACSTREEDLRAERVRAMLDRSISGEERLRMLAFPDGEELSKSYSEEKAAALFAAFVRNGTWHTPTLALLDGFARAEDSRNDARQKYLAPAWRENWDPKKSFYLRDLSAEQYAALNARIRGLMERYEKLIAEMHRAGVEFLAGTDANGWNPVFPGFGLHRELELLVESGLTPMEALQAATRNAAMYFGRLAVMGTIEKGKAADVVLLDADPLKNIRNTEKIEAVVMRGRYFSRADLDQMLDRAEKAVLSHK